MNDKETKRNIAKFMGFNVNVTNLHLYNLKKENSDNKESMAIKHEGAVCMILMVWLEFLI